MAQGQPLTTPPRSSTKVVPGLTVAMRGRQRFEPRRLLSTLLFVGPALLLIAFFVVYPAIKTLLLSFQTETGIGYNAPLQWVGFDNYTYMVQDDAIRTAIINNILWLVIVTPVTVVLGVIFAVLFDRVRYEPVAKSIVFIPMAISGTAAGVIWYLMYAADVHVGTINAILAHLIPNFQPIAFLGTSSFVNFALGFAVIVLSAALKAIPKELTEAARIDGAREFTIFRRITIPLMWPTITVIITLTMIGVLKIFDLIDTMTSGGPADASDVLALRMYIEAFKNANPGYGSAIAVVLLIAVVPIMAINIRRFSSDGAR